MGLSVILILLIGTGIGIFVASGRVSEKKHEQHQNLQKIEQPEQKEHDTSGYSFQKGKKENK